MQFLRDVGRDVTRPAFSRIECDYADRIRILTAEKVADDGLEVGAFVIGLGPDPARSSNREETSVLKMDAYDAYGDIPCYRLKTPCSSKYFPC